MLVTDLASQISILLNEKAPIKAKPVKQLKTGQSSVLIYIKLHNRENMFKAQSAII